MPAAGEPFELWIKLAGSEEDTYMPDSPTMMELIIGVQACDPDEEDLRPPEEGWGGSLYENPLTRLVWRVECYPHTIHSSLQDAGDLRLFWRLKRKPFKYLVDTNVPRIVDFYMDPARGFTLAEITQYGLLPLFSSENPLPVVLTDYSKTLTKKTGTNLITFTLKSRYVN